MLSFTKKIALAIVFTACVFILCSCHQKAKNSRSDKICQEILIDRKKSQDINIKDFAQTIKFIKLETTKESLFTFAQKIIVNSSGIFILDGVALRKVFHFSLEGKFLRTIGYMGRGEGEYIMPIDFIVNSKNNTVEIADNISNTIFVYDFKNNYLKKIQHKEYRISAFTKVDDGEFLVKLGFNMGMKYEKYNFLVTKVDRVNIVDKLIATTSKADFVYKSSPFSNILDDSLFFNFGLNDTIYQYSKSSYSASYYINFGDSRLPIEKLKHDDERALMELLLGDNYCGYISSLFQQKNYLYFSFLSKKKEYFCYYNRDTGKKLIIANIVGPGNILYDRPPQTIYKESLIFVLDAGKFTQETAVYKAAAENGFGVFASMEEVVKVTQANDNPIIVLMKPKDI